MSIAAEQWKAQWTAEGRAEGISIGKADMLLRQLHRRFGRVSPELKALVNQADSGQLDHWMDQLMDAGTLTDIFPGRQPQ